ncbi:MAG: NAD-dependent epimerase/dehydratase family protein [Pseudomonadota bacterium]
MKIAVTGASGHVGANLIRELLSQKYDVRALIHEDCLALDGLDIEKVKIDVTNEDSLFKAFENIDIVFHLAAIISIIGGRKGKVYNTNVIGTRNVVSACLKRKVKRLVHFSSIHAFAQDPLNEALNETRKLVDEDGKKHPAYDMSKAQGIREVQKGISMGLDAIIVCPTAVLGPNDYRHSRMGKVLCMLSKQTLPGLVGGGFNWVDARDVSRGAIEASKNGKTGEIYLLSGNWHSVKELAQFVEKVSGKKSPSITYPLWMANIGAMAITPFAKILDKEPLFTTEAMLALKANQNILCDKAQKDFGYSPRDTHETVKDTLTWFDKEGIIKLKK